MELDWIFGRREYLVAILILVSYKRLTIPSHLLDEVEPLYIDNNELNNIPLNLIYRFKNGPLAVENFPGFYYIPFNTNYAINVTGRIINISTGKEKTWSITPKGGPKNQTGGYLYTRVIDDGGVSRVLFIHRALCLVFKKYENDVLSMVVNHKDGCPSINTLENLEWCTYKENNAHAVKNGLTAKNSKSVLVKNLDTQEIISFPSIAECARKLSNISPGTIIKRIEKFQSSVFSDKLVFKYDDGSKWQDIDVNDKNIFVPDYISDIAARNVFTGDIVIFKGCGAGFEITGVKAATILRHIRENAVIPINGWNFRYLELAKDWPIHSERHLKIFEKHPIYPSDGVIALDINTNEELFFTSTSEAANYFSLSKDGFWRVLNNSLLIRNKFKLKLFRLR